MDTKRWIKIVIALAAAGSMLALPAEAFGIEGLTVLQQRMIAVFVAAMFFWILEPIPIFATSVGIILAMLVFMSDKSLIWLRPEDPLPYARIMGTFADPIIMLFLGGMMIGDAATKFKLDTNLGRVLLRPFGYNPKFVLLGIMLATAIISMFMSNTACTAMMLAVMMPVLRSIAPDDPARVGFALSIPFAANIGGIGTPVGTPPNAVAMKYLTERLVDPASPTNDLLISFAEWMLFAVPFMIVLLLICWGLLLWMFPPKAKRIEADLSGKWVKSPRAWIVYITTSLTILLWLLGDLHGMNESTVAMIPVGVFLICGVIDSNDLKKISWDVLWLIAGGFALGLGLQQSGLAKAMIASIPFAEMSPLLVVGIACAVTFVMANFMSHTATSNLLLPVMATLAAAVPTLGEVGGPVGLILAVTFCSSLSMTFPISTPPNALAYATGWVPNREMAKSGLLTGLVGLGLLVGMMLMLTWMGYFAGFSPASVGQ